MSTALIVIKNQNLQELWFIQSILKIRHQFLMGIQNIHLYPDRQPVQINIRFIPQI